MPDAAAHLWNWFVELISGADAGMGPAVVSWQTLKAWSDLTGIRPEPWETRALVRLGNLRARILSEDTGGGSDKN